MVQVCVIRTPVVAYLPYSFPRFFFRMPRWPKPPSSRRARRQFSTRVFLDHDIEEPQTIIFPCSSNTYDDHELDILDQEHDKAPANPSNASTAVGAEPPSAGPSTQTTPAQPPAGRRGGPVDDQVSPFFCNSSLPVTNIATGRITL